MTFSQLPPQSSSSGSPVRSSADMVHQSSELAQISEQIHQIQNQLSLLWQRLEAHDRTPATIQVQSRSAYRYSANMTLAMGAFKWLFLFIAGVLIACVLAASLQSIPTVGIIMHLVNLCLAPLTAVTLGVITVAVIFESVR